MNTARQKTIIEISNLSKIIKGQVILDQINLQLISGNIYGFVGHNGSGKTMLFKTICGFVIPTQGEVHVMQKKVGKDISFPDEVGILIENPGFLPNYNAFQNLKYLASIQNKISNQDIKNTIKSVGLNPENKKPVKTYSLGMKQRLGIAQAIMENPKILILDEPMNALDIDGVNLIRDLLINFKNKGGTILITSHNQDDLDSMCDITFQMDNGKLKKETKGA
ncbi:ABC-2 type transport system ATP-binding protein [Natranaerovirga hydrolytica]|uniref:ABC-2 type transport system ATP-binding protein n=1 Tax=Natranaerovirga hydrolytica TaxID=680378 RepID=A0A4V2PZN5_9FIRM|nr:ATP-binding cassette domain-containing protein [Natranaerovirga hydrolytica]TCK90541.1 ABC-2 type transport system ATP-binding protein [Natranaerovirga hydrolytica]